MAEDKGRIADSDAPECSTSGEYDVSGQASFEDHDSSSKHEMKPLSRQDCMASFKLLYESRDGELCVFEKKDGRVVAVKGSRLV